MPVAVRPLEPHDRAEWLALFRDYVAFYRADVPPEVVDMTWSRLMDGGPEMLGLCAEGPGRRLVGIALVIFHRSTWSATCYCYLEDLFVAPEARGRGVGRALIEAVYAAADARGATRTYWVTETSNTEARRLYDSLATQAPYVQYRRT
jgi:GNAT superfamily N-acetyltransferase